MMRMNRRKLLCSASAAVIAARLTVSSATAENAGVSENLEVRTWTQQMVEKALDVMRDYKFGLHAQARLLGINPDSVKSVDELRHTIDEMPKLSAEFCRRVLCITSIRSTLERRLGPDVSEHLHWLGSHKAIADYSCRDLMERGIYLELLFVTTYIEKIVG